MYTEFNGRQWSSEEKYLEFKSNVRLYMSRSLGVENYADCTGDDSVYDDISFQLLKQYREKKDKMSEDELLESTAIIIEEFDNLLNKIGRDKFIFYEDGDVNYIWPKKK